MVAAVGWKIAKEHRKAQTPHGKQSVRKLMGHGGDTNAIEVDTPKLFDKVARKWGVDYAIRRVGDEKYLLLFKARQADAITGCFAEYSRLELKRAKSRQTPIREQLRQAEEQVKKQPQRELTKEAAHGDR
ncbi:PcfB family protein [Clostridium sp. AM27-28]|nr:PcfB family protein [Clostridium sp. AM27-28]RHT95443.1 PcfB family protein [Clostridium sp. AM27-28]